MIKQIIFLTIFFCNLTALMNAQCVSIGVNNPVTKGQLLSTTGSSKLDNILYTESSNMKNTFEINIPVYAVDDTESPNCTFRPSASIITMGKTMMLDEIVETNGTNSIISIMAHEFGHAIQHKYNLNVNSDWIGKYPELHADFMAGWYMGKKKYLSSQEVLQIGKSFYEMGDYDYFNLQHHGTKDERLFAFYSGFLNSDLNVFDAYRYGTNVIADVEENLIKFNTASASKTTNTNNNSVELNKPGYLCLYSTNKKALKRELYINNQYVGFATSVYQGMPSYGSNGTISLPLTPGTYNVGIKYVSGGAFMGSTKIHFTQITVSKDGNFALDVSQIGN